MPKGSGEVRNTQAEYEKVRRSFQATGVVALAVLVTGTVFYHIVEKLNWLDSIYFSVITLATVGYGDITPHTNLGKLFTIFYVLTGVGIIATFANLLIRRAALKRELKQLKKR
jgi:voltage-gated potassium channel Kch